jgi:hypothetical protein
MQDETILVEELSMPEGVTRKTHFLAIRKNLSVVAILKTDKMIAKAVETRKKKTAIKKKIQDKKQTLALERAKRKTQRDEIKEMRTEYKKKMEQLRKESRIQKEMLESKLKNSRK